MAFFYNQGYIIDSDFQNFKEFEQLINLNYILKLNLEHWFKDACDKHMIKPIIRQCRSLKELKMPPKYQGDLEHLENTSLTHLDCSGCNIYSIGMLWFLNLNSYITHLYLGGCKNIEISILEKLQHCENLEHLDLSYWPDVNADALEILFYTQKLEYLNLSHCPNLDLDTLLALKELNSLNRLDLTGCNNLSTADLKTFHLARYQWLGSERQSLQIVGCDHLTDDGSGSDSN